MANDFDDLATLNKLIEQREEVAVQNKTGWFARELSALKSGRDALQQAQKIESGEVTNEMCKAGMTAFENTFGSPYTRYAAIFKAMLQAAPDETKG